MIRLLLFIPLLLPLFLPLFLPLLLPLFLLTACEKVEIRDSFERYLWHNRVLLIFTPGKDHPLFAEQQGLVLQHNEGIKERDVVTWIFIRDNYVMVDGAYKPQLPVDQFYDYFDVSSNEFTVMLIGKDGDIKLRKNSEVVSNEVLFSLIDAMPMRQREMREK